MTKVRHLRPAVSKMYFLEAARWTVGKDKFTVCIGEEDGPKIPVAYVRIEGFDDNKKAILSCRDLDGNKLFETTNNIYELKCQFQDNEITLTQAMQERDEKIEKLIEQDFLREPEHEGREISPEEWNEKSFDQFVSQHEPERDEDLELEFPLYHNEDRQGVQQEKTNEVQEELEESRSRTNNKKKSQNIER
ncbi:MAG: hypothetical protein ABIQ40_18670 [Bacteroidia bacterium]